MDQLFCYSLFDFDDTKTLLLWFLIKLLSVSEMNLTPKAKVSFRMMRIQHPWGRFESHMKKNWIPKVWIRILIPESVFRGEEVKFGLQIRIPEVWIWIPIPKSFLNSEKVKFGLWIRISSVKAIDKSWICTLIKKGIFVYIFDIF